MEIFTGDALLGQGGRLAGEAEYADACGGRGEENGLLKDRRMAGGIDNQRGGYLPLRQLFRQRLVSVIQRQIGAVVPRHLQTFGNAVHYDHLLNAIHPLQRTDRRQTHRTCAVDQGDILRRGLQLGGNVCRNGKGSTIVA